MNLRTLTTTVCHTLAAVLFLTACSKKDTVAPPGTGPGQPSPKKIQFATEVISLSENSNGTTVELLASAMVTRTETVEIGISPLGAEYGRDYNTVPAAENGRIRLRLESGTTKASLRIIPVNNNTRDPQRRLTLAIQTQGSSLVPEGKTSLQVILADDEGPASASFVNAEQQVVENENQEILIPVRFTKGLGTPATIDVRLVPGSAVYGQHYTLTPAPVNNLVRMAVAAGQTEALIRLRVINDGVFNEDRNFRLQLAPLPDGMEAGPLTETRVTIRNEDPAPATFIPIGQLRSQFQGSDILFWIDTRFQGVVTTNHDNFPANLLYLEDETGGIAVRFTGSPGLQPGERIAVNLQGAVLREANGILEIQGLDPAAVQRVATEMVFAPEMSIAQLYAAPASQEGRLVTLTGGRFPEANGIVTRQGERTLFDGVRSVTVRTESFASFRNLLLPAGPVSVTGILAEQGGRYILYPISGSSIR